MVAKMTPDREPSMRVLRLSPEQRAAMIAEEVASAELGPADQADEEIKDLIRRRQSEMIRIDRRSRQLAMAMTVVVVVTVLGALAGTILSLSPDTERNIPLVVVISFVTFALGVAAGSTYATLRRRMGRRE